MSRTAIYNALILRSRTCGESNREIWFLCAEAGIIKATLFGGPKSKLRSHAAPFHSGQIWIYHDPIKDFYKLTDFDVQSWRPGIRELYERTMAADAIAHTILATHAGGGNWDSALKLAKETLDALEIANEELCTRMLIYFLWHWADFLGIKPQFDSCVSCGKNTEIQNQLFFSAREGGMVCKECADGGALGQYTNGLLLLNPGCLRWLSTIDTLAPSKLSSYTMDIKTLNETKTLASAILAGALGQWLVSWNW